MLRLGYKLSSEGFGPADLVRQAVRAEEAGFDFALSLIGFCETQILPRLRRIGAAPRRTLARRRAA